MSVNDGSRAGSSCSLDEDDGSAISNVKSQISFVKRELTKEHKEANGQLVRHLKLEKKTVFNWHKSIFSVDKWHCTLPFVIIVQMA